MLSALRMRIASITVALPSALSVAPVPVCHESRWAPTITISSLIALSVPGISAITFKGVAIVLVVRRLISTASFTGILRLQHARDEVVVLRGEDDRRAPRWRPDSRPVTNSVPCSPMFG
jgi:hypothetical protein